jgi:hypothetical protein
MEPRGMLRKNQVIRYDLIQGSTGQAFAFIKHLAAGDDIGIRSWEALLGYYEPNQESLATSYIHKNFSPRMASGEDLSSHGIRRRSLLAWHQEKISRRIASGEDLSSHGIRRRSILAWHQEKISVLSFPS